MAHDSYEADKERNGNWFGVLFCFLSFSYFGLRSATTRGSSGGRVCPWVKECHMTDKYLCGGYYWD